MQLEGRDGIQRGQMLLQLGLEIFKWRQRFAACVHLDVQIIGQAKMPQLQQMQGDIGLLLFDQPGIQARSGYEPAMDSVQHAQCRLYRRITLP